MKITKGIYQATRVLILQSPSGAHPVQLRTHEFIEIGSKVYGGYIGSVNMGRSKQQVIIKNEQVKHLIRVRGN